MLPKTIDSYGGPRVDAEAVRNPVSQYPSSDFNRAHEDLAQLTRTGIRALVIFPTNSLGAPNTVPAASVQHRNLWGTGVSTKPAVTKNGAGLYTVTWAASYQDGLGVSESVGLIFPVGWALWTGDAADRLLLQWVSIGSNTVQVQCLAEPGGGVFAVSDTGLVSGDPINVALAVV